MLPNAVALSGLRAERMNVGVDLAVQQRMVEMKSVEAKYGKPRLFFVRRKVVWYMQPAQPAGWIAESVIFQ
jgi:hypothetical protein